MKGAGLTQPLSMGMSLPFYHHMHLEELVDKEWVGPRIYPHDVPHN